MGKRAAIPSRAARFATRSEATGAEGSSEEAGVKPVSYTHLVRVLFERWVNKRSPALFHGAHGRGDFQQFIVDLRLAGLVAVSYTHLVSGLQEALHSRGCL